jgi:uncharacterized SAM-binding protein YcdF (DUF218 family)
MTKVMVHFWRIFSTLCALSVLAACLVAFNLESLLMLNEPLRKADHAVVLDGNNERLLRAKELLDQGLVEDILVSDGEPAHPDEIERIVDALGYKAPDRTFIKQQILGYLGVPAEKIIVFGHGSLTTRDEAQSLKTFLGDQSPKLILVTTNYHSRRATMIFRAALPMVDVQVTCQGGCIAPAKWWKDPAVAAQFVLEFVKQIYYELGLAKA